ncbi:uncharacterized protein LAJ45_03052 [Morchella importuna]|uniref:uncharacterized protein n=1 Tax=Morchella importuna TaxID=1174673 RepID=UPI001E8D5F4E|nr:uncharacterized protein LAJ45_03052 [Morchella importuna]KAH8152826.1 hypothetical protein LAJ45_03052 [Morchella importuna]
MTICSYPPTYASNQHTSLPPHTTPPPPPSLSPPQPPPKDQRSTRTHNVTALQPLPALRYPIYGLHPHFKHSTQQLSQHSKQPVKTARYSPQQTKIAPQQVLKKLVQSALVAAGPRFQRAEELVPLGSSSSEVDEVASMGGGLV